MAPWSEGIAGDPQVPEQHPPAAAHRPLCPPGAGALPSLHTWGRFPLAAHGPAGAAGGNRGLHRAAAGRWVPVLAARPPSHPAPQGSAAGPAPAGTRGGRHLNEDPLSPYTETQSPKPPEPEPPPWGSLLTVSHIPNLAGTSFGTIMLRPPPWGPPSWGPLLACLI